VPLRSGGPTRQIRHVLPARELVADLVEKGLLRAPQRVRTIGAAQRFLGDLALRERYGTGRRFTNAISAWMAPNRGHVMYDTWLDYALSTNLRGATVVRRLAERKPVPGARALDVGCAYGGFSVAFAEAGGEAVGIDVDATLLSLATMNVMDKRAPVALAHLDVTDGAGMRALGRFDFITCCDVIEHVADVPATLANLAAALAPGGLLHLQIPNARASALVLADGHFAAFAITLLGREDALRYFAEKRFGGAYDVGTYLDLDEYLTMLARHGVAARGNAVQNAPEDAPAAIARVEALLTDVEAALQRSRSDQEISNGTRALLEERVGGYLHEVRADLAALRSPATGSRDVLARAFARRYAIDCWDVVLFKSA